MVSIKNIETVIEKTFKELMNEITIRCEKVGIELVKSDSEEEEEYWEVLMPSGREKKTIYIWDAEDAEDFLEIELENYICFHEYAAICSYKLGVIEACIQRPNRMPSRFINNRLFGRSTNDEDELCITMDQSNEVGKIKTSIGEISNELKMLTRNRSGNLLSIKIEGIEINNYNKALNILEKISNAIFFQIDLCKDLAFTLLREGQRRAIKREIKSNKEFENFKFPSTLFDSEPISLYWYARNSNGIPLLQYLAFYQAIEFYFPVYSEMEAKKTIKNILKNPMFNPNNDLDLTKVLSSLKSKIGKGYDNERNQLKSTLKECINIDDFKTFIEDNKYIHDFIVSNDSKKISKHKINMNLNHDELLNIIAERIYEIRCKIVHTKAYENDGTAEILLPFSKEANDLFYDVELVKYIAQQIIIFNGKIFTL